MFDTINMEFNKARLVILRIKFLVFFAKKTMLLLKYKSFYLHNKKCIFEGWI